MGGSLQLLLLMQAEEPENEVLVLANQGITKRDAAARVAETSGVSQAALLKRLERKGKSPRGVHGNRKLSKDQEDVLMGILLSFSGSNCGLKPKQVVGAPSTSTHPSQPPPG